MSCCLISISIGVYITTQSITLTPTSTSTSTSTSTPTSTSSTMSIPVPSNVNSHGNENERARASFNCPTGKSLANGTIIYGTSPDKTKTFVIPKGMINLSINNMTMGGDPNPNVFKTWDATCTCA